MEGVSACQRRFPSVSKDKEQFSRRRDRDTTFWMERDLFPDSSGACVLPGNSPPRGCLTSCRPASETRLSMGLALPTLTRRVALAPACTRGNSHVACA